MTVNIYWQNEEQGIIRYDFFGDWTWDELYTAFEQSVKMGASIDGRVDVILDMRKSGRTPSNALTHLRTIADQQLPNHGLSIFVTKNQFLRAMYSVGSKMYGGIKKQFRVVTTVDDGLQEINQSRQQT